MSERMKAIRERLETMRGIGPQATVAKLNSAADIAWLLDRVEALETALCEVRDVYAPTSQLAVHKATGIAHRALTTDDL